jgi:hypothetical protein
MAATEKQIGCRCCSHVAHAKKSPHYCEEAPLCCCTEFCGPKRKFDETNFQCRGCRRCLNLQGIETSDADLPDFGPNYDESSEVPW